MSLTDLTPSQLRKAAALKERIDALNSELAGLLTGVTSTPSGGTAPQGTRRGPRRRRTMSPAARAKIAAAARARWAKAKAAGKSRL